MLETAEPPKRDLDFFLWIHWTLSLGLVGVLLFFFGCMEIQEQKATLGSLVEAQSVADALVMAQGEANPWLIKKGEAVLYDFTQEIEGSPPSLFLQISQQVLALEDIEDSESNQRLLKVTYVGTEFDPETGEQKEVSFTREYDPELYGLSLDGSPQAQSLYGEKLLAAFAGQEDPEISSRPIIKETYHDLRVTQLRMVPPPLVSARNRCGGVLNCELRVNRVVYDKAEWTSESDFQKVTYEYDISQDPPYSGLILKECVATQVKVEARKYFVRNCMNLKDFLYGE